MNQEILTVTVSQLNHYIKRVIENNSYLKNIWIKGEISNCKLHHSGHIYLTLKDDTSVLRAVMFRTAAASLRFQPENGMKVLARGRISVYERDGQYQLYIEEMQPDGVGALHIAYEQLKARLAEEGLFDERFKKPLPQYPQTIGVITALTGAAVRDIIHVLSRRCPAARIRILPVLVQGEQAAAQIADAISFMNKKKLADVLIVGRGGGSIEDLWAFNEEIVARAIFSSDIPVISAVGHETDFTIADFVADRRAPTPSAAAEIAVPSFSEIYERLSSCQAALTYHMSQRLERQKQRLELLARSRSLSGFSKILEDYHLRLCDMQADLEEAEQTILKNRNDCCAQLFAKLDALSPLKVLARGYAVAARENGKMLTSITQIKENDFIRLRVTDGTIDCIAKGVRHENT